MTMNLNKRLKIKKGNSKVYELAFTDKNGGKINIEGWVVCFTLNSKDNSHILTKVVRDHIDCINGRTVINLSEAETALHTDEYYFNIKVKTALSEIKNVQSGTLTIEPNPSYIGEA